MTPVVAVGLLVALSLAAGAARDTPLTVVLLVDVTTTVSEAMAMPEPPPTDQKAPIAKKPDGPRDLFARPVERGFIRGLAAGDRARIGSISRAFRLSSNFTADRVALVRARDVALDVDEGERYGPSPLWDGVDAAITALETEPGRRAVVLVTDGLSTGNRRGIASVIEHAVRAEVAVSVVCEAWGLPRSSRYGKWASADKADRGWKILQGGDPEANLRRLTSATGGVYVLDGAQGNDPALDAALAAVLQQLRRR